MSTDECGSHPSLEDLIFAVDGHHHQKPQLVKIQRTMGCDQAPVDMPTRQPSHPRLREQFRRWG